MILYLKSYCYLYVSESLRIIILHFKEIEAPSKLVMLDIFVFLFALILICIDILIGINNLKSGNSLF